MTYPWPILWPKRLQWPFRSVWPSLWPQKVKGSLEVAVTYFMTPKVTVTFVWVWPSLWPPKGHGVIRGDLLYDSKGHGDFCVRFDLVYDPKKSRSHLRSAWPTLWPQRSWWPVWSLWPSSWPQKGTGSLAVAMTYFMKPKVKVTFVVSLT